MRILTAIVLMVISVSGCATPRDSKRIGLVEKFDTADGWFEWDDKRNENPPRAKLEAKDGMLHVHTFRGLLRVKHDWMPEGHRKGSILRKNYGEVDLDKYHYLVVTIHEKGSGVFFGINGFDTKAGYTTGTTAIDLKDYDSKSIHGKQAVRFEMDLHDNLTTLIVDEIKLVSELTAEEKKGFVDRGLTIRAEKMEVKKFHGLDAVMSRARTRLPSLDGEEMVVFRDTATGALITRLTANKGNDYFGEGGCWSGDGAAIRFTSNGRFNRGKPVLLLGKGKVVAAPNASWVLWTAHDAKKLWLVTRRGKKFEVALWDRPTDKTEPVATFTVPKSGGYTEVKRITASGKLVVGFRETPYLAVIDAKAKTAKVMTLSTRLKDVGFTPDEKYLTWANCYTYESRWLEVATGKEGLCSRYNVGHSSGGKSGTVGSFGRHLKIFIPRDVFNTRTAGDRITVWANWQNDVITDYGSLTDDSKWIFTNGIRGEVNRQHVMIPSADTGAVLRVARYFTKFSWSSTTYSRPSPDYTKLVFNENMDKAWSTEIMMAYTRLPDPPGEVRIVGKQLSWKVPERSREAAGYNIYSTTTSGRGYVRLNEKLVTGTSFNLPDTTARYAVTMVEYSGLEGQFSDEATSLKGGTYYFQAEDMALTPPARRFYDGYAGGFQCVRINAESPAEKKSGGRVAIDVSKVRQGSYTVWARVKGQGSWVVAGKPAVISLKDWQWVKVGAGFSPGRAGKLELVSRNDNLKCDTVMLTTEGFEPSGLDPRDLDGPVAVTGLKARALGGSKVSLSWEASSSKDVAFYSIYCGTTADFQPGNATVIRSVRKTGITDAGGPTGKVWYKVVAFDRRFNAGKVATIEVNVR